MKKKMILPLLLALVIGKIQKTFYGKKSLKINQIYGFGAVIIFMLIRIDMNKLKNDYAL